MGDASDNIPGIPGVGEKTALKMLHEFGSVEEVLANADSLKGKLKEKVEAHQEDARMSKKLATIYREVELADKVNELDYSGYDPSVLAAMFRKLEFKSLIERLELPEAGGDAGAVIEEAKYEVVLARDLPSDELTGLLAKSESVYFEAIGENPHQAKLIGLAAAGAGGETVVVITYDELMDPSVAEPVRRWLEDEDAPKRGYDLHKAELALAWIGISLKGTAFDVLLAAYLLDPTESSQTLASLVPRYQLPGLAPDEAVYGKGAKFLIPEASVLARHLAAKAEAVRRLVPLQQADLETGGMHKLYYELEQPLAIVLAGMEKQGIKVNAGTLEDLGAELAQGISRYESDIYMLAGMEFNINSPKQLGEVLFDKLDLPVIKKTKTGYSTDAEVLEKLAPYHEIVKLILHYRQLAKLQSTYVEGLLKEIRERYRQDSYVLPADYRRYRPAEQSIS